MSELKKQVTRIVIDATLQEVWDVLTKEDEKLPFFFGSVLKTTGLKPGAPMRMRTPDGKYTGVVGEVLEFDPPYRYVTTFKFTAFDDPVCIVRHELREVEGGVEYTLTAEQVPPDTKTQKQMKQGAALITKTLKAMVETGRPPLSTRLILGVISATTWLTPKKCLSENWPFEKTIE